MTCTTLHSIQVTSPMPGSVTASVQDAERLTPVAVACGCRCERASDAVRRLWLERCADELSKGCQTKANDLSNDAVT